MTTIEEIKFLKGKLGSVSIKMDSKRNDLLYKNIKDKFHHQELVLTGY
jgi:hypothetical protein